MSVGFPHVKVGEPLRYQALSVFPLFDGVMSPVEYTLSNERIGSGSVTVEERKHGQRLVAERFANSNMGETNGHDLTSCGKGLRLNDYGHLRGVIGSPLAAHRRYCGVPDSFIPSWRVRLTCSLGRTNDEPEASR